ncbi:MAG: hypothetical protein IT168_10515 [Bryobacterales bacterium]|nr:hypothetical protein [Bryobacterales bacterium]
MRRTVLVLLAGAGLIGCTGGKDVSHGAREGVERTGSLTGSTPQPSQSNNESRGPSSAEAYGTNRSSGTEGTRGR